MKNTNDFRQQVMHAVKDRGMTLAELSRRTGVPYGALTKLMAREGASTSAENAAAISKELDLTGFQRPAPDVSAARHIVTGMSENQTEAFTLKSNTPSQDAPNPLLSQIFGKLAARPSTLKLSMDIPGFALCRGDIMVIDSSRLPEIGELCIVTTGEGPKDQATLVRRYMPPHLDAGSPAGKSLPLQVDNPNVIVRAPIIGIIRGVEF